MFKDSYFLKEGKIESRLNKNHDHHYDEAATNHINTKIIDSKEEYHINLDEYYHKQKSLIDTVVQREKSIKDIIDKQTKDMELKQAATLAQLKQYPYLYKNEIDLLEMSISNKNLNKLKKLKDQAYADSEIYGLQAGRSEYERLIEEGTPQSRLNEAIKSLKMKSRENLGYAFVTYSLREEASKCLISLAPH